MWSLVFTLIVADLLQGVHSAQWSSTSPQDGDVKYVCTGGSVTLSWNYILSSGDALGAMKWYYNGNSQVLVALLSDGVFVPLPAFASRVQFVDNAGISLNDLAIADAGNYSVEIHIYRDSGTSHTVLRRSVLVQVNDHLVTQDGDIHVTQGSEPVLDTTDQWAIQLQCGIFTFRGDPSFQVEWILPSGIVVNSSDYSDNHFNLLLTNPSQGGNYTCRVPPQHAADACLHGNVQASINVDKVDARLSLLEKENEQLKQQLKQSHLNLSQQVQVKVDGLQNQVQSLEQVKVAGLQNRVEALEDRTRQQIGFHATGLQSHTPLYGKSLIVNNMHYNHGNAYNGTTGYFTTPYPGVYFFAGTTGHYGAGSASHSLYVDNIQLSAANTQEDHASPSQSTVHAVVHLTTGQRVRIRSNGNRYVTGFLTSFSGFLISPDP